MNTCQKTESNYLWGKDWYDIGNTIQCSKLPSKGLSSFTSELFKSFVTGAIHVLLP